MASELSWIVNRSIYWLENPDIQSCDGKCCNKSWRAYVHYDRRSILVHHHSGVNNVDLYPEKAHFQVVLQHLLVHRVDHDMLSRPLWLELPFGR